MYPCNYIITSRETRNKQFAALVLSLIGVLFFVIQSIAQVSQPRRYEAPYKSSDEQFTIISLKEEGLAVDKDLSKYKEGKKVWELTLLDTALQEKAKIDIPVNDRHKMVGYEFAPGHLYFLFRTGETTKNDFELIDIDLKGSEAGRFSFKPDLDFKLTHFSKAGDNFTFGGYVNNEPTVVLFEVKDNHIRVIPGFFQKNTELVDLRTNQNRTFNTVLMDRGTRENRKLIFKKNFFCREMGDLVLRYGGLKDSIATISQLLANPFLYLGIPGSYYKHNLNITSFTATFIGNKFDSLKTA